MALRTMDSYLDKIVIAQKRGQARGITSICSANPFVIEAGFRQALAAEHPVLIESTCNQVNQHGGYTGMTPADFVTYVERIAHNVGFPRDRIIIGGDHLGPNPWRDKPADQAMEEARVLIRDCVLAGYEKIHLDASMKCADDDPDRPLDKAIAAQRAATLAQVAEQAFNLRLARSGDRSEQLLSRQRQVPPYYVIGTEVPVPGGAEEHEDAIHITRPDDVAETIDMTRQAFLQRGLDDAWERVIAVVVQPGVEFSDSDLFEYDHQAALELSRLIEQYDRLVYEAHSTDYQTAQALKHMVEDHFAVLKVGPALTFAFREAVFALAAMEEEWLSDMPGVVLSRVREVLEAAMLRNPTHWRSYYRGDERYQRFARKYSFSDRSRYYWPLPEVQAALAQLIENLETYPPPLSLLSQYLPVQYQRIRNRTLENVPRALILDKIASVLDDYAFACTPGLQEA